MDIQEIKNKKLNTEIQIAKLLRRFEAETGLDISAIDYRVDMAVYTATLVPTINKTVELKILI